MKIILGEDNLGDVYLIRDALSASLLPVTMEHVTDGEQLLAYLRREGVYAEATTPDLIMLDLAMPRKDGWTVLRELQAIPELRDIPLVVFTGVLTPTIQQQLAALGVMHAVQKPLDLTTYEDAIHGIVACWNLHHGTETR